VKGSRGSICVIVPNFVVIGRTYVAEIYSRLQNWDPPRKGRAGSPSNTMLPGPRPTSVPSGILNPNLSYRLAPIHQCYRQTGQTTVR